MNTYTHRISLLIQDTETLEDFLKMLQQDSLYDSQRDMLQRYGCTVEPEDEKKILDGIRELWATQEESIRAAFAQKAQDLAMFRHLIMRQHEKGIRPA